jgi:hypothetical protein
VTCRCGRDNDARRCYCGGCGQRIGKPCARCPFVNAGDDAFCGGCGDALEAAVVSVVRDRPTEPITRPARAPASADTMSAAELASLLGKAAAPTPAALPAIVSQDDLDRLFGGVS